MEVMSMAYPGPRAPEPEILDAAAIAARFAELADRIERLERRVRELEDR